MDISDVVEGTAAFEAKVQEIADRVKAIVRDGSGGDAKGEAKAASAPAPAPAPTDGEAKGEAKTAPTPAPVRAPAPALVPAPAPSYVYPSGPKANSAVPDGVGYWLYDAAMVFRSLCDFEFSNQRFQT